MNENKTYVDYVYDIVRDECEHIAIYEQYIINLVGSYGLNALLNAGLIKHGGILSGKQLYELVEKGEEK